MMVIGFFSWDWNMTNLFGDSIRPSPRLHGIEERSWRRLMDKLNLIDIYQAAACRKGSIYTHQAQSGSRSD